MNFINNMLKKYTYRLASFIFINHEINYIQKIATANVLILDFNMRGTLDRMNET